MNRNWTLEPWEPHWLGDGIQVYGSCDTIDWPVMGRIATFHPLEYIDSDGRIWRTYGTVEGNMLRAIACVNACKKFNDPSKEILELQENHNKMKEVLTRVEVVLSEGLARSEKEVCDLLDVTNMNHATGIIWAEVCEVLRESK